MEEQLAALESVNIGKMLKGLSFLSQEERKIRNETYQEYQLLSIDNVKKSFLSSLHKLYEQGVQSKLLNNIVKDHNKYFTCLLAYSEQINEVINEASFFTFSHKNFISESALLAFYLAKERKRKVILAIANDSLVNVSHMIAGQAEEDKISFAKSALLKEGVELLNLCEWQRGGVTLPAEAVVVVDVFGLSPTAYAPFLLRNYAAIAKASKAFLYHSHLQNEEVAELLAKVAADAFPIQLWTDHPCQNICSKDEQMLLNQLIDFLKQDLNHPEKQDIVIFYPIDQHIRRYNSKLGEHLSKAGLKEHVVIISKPHLRQTNSKNNIFLVESTEQLLDWNYDYANVLYVIDYGKESRLSFNYQLCSFVEENTFVSTTEKAKRQSLVGNHHFGIYTCFPIPELQRPNILDIEKDITIYLLKMIDYQLVNFLDLDNQRVRHALAVLQKLSIINQQGKSFTIIDQQAINFAKHGVSPIESKFICTFSKNTTLSKRDFQKYTNLAIFMITFLHTKENIKKIKHDNEAFVKAKPTQIWRKSGYIESCIAVIASCEATQISLARKNESESDTFRRNSSKMEQSQADPFGSFYQLIQGATGEESSEKISIPTFLQQNSIEEDIFFRIREEIDHYRQVFSAPKVSIIFSKEDFITILKEYVTYFKESLLFYTGYLRKGYQSESLKFKDDYIQINTESLKKELNIKPLFISAMRYQIKNGAQQISIWNSVSQAVYLEVLGSLPIIEKLSKVEAELQFHGISSLVFEKLWRNSGSQILRFEEQNNCFIEPNHEVAMVIIHCDKQHSNEIKSKFQKVLEKIKESISSSNRLTHHIGNMKFYQGAGGLVKELVFGEYISKGLVENLHLEATTEDLEQLIEEFIVVRDITVRLPQPGKQTKSAVIYFNSQRDFYTFYECFNQCFYCGFQLKITPIKKSRQEFAWEKQYIEFKWYVWQTHNKALIRFADEQAAKKAFESLADPTLDGVKVEPTIDGKNLTIDNLNDITDEIVLEELFKAYGSILEVEILKTPLREALNDNLTLENLIVGVIQNKCSRMQAVERGKSGLRTCIVSFDNYEDMMKVAGKYHKTVDVLGLNRLYAFTKFQRSMQISDSLRNVAHEIVLEIVEEHENMNIITPEKFRYEFIGEQMIFYSPDKIILDRYYNQISARMKGSNIKLKKAEKTLVFNEIGFANLLDLEEKYNCKLIINIATQTLTAICRARLFETISKEITARIINSFFYKIYLNSKSYNHFKLHPQRLTEIKTKYSLKLVELQGEEQSIIIEGSVINVQNANTYFMYFIESLNKPEEERVHSDVCGICCEEPKASYRLQSCFHRFCVVCMQTYIRNILGDRSQFPIKCPHCSQLIIVEDLNLILDKTQWQRVETMALNQYIADNSDKMSFCYTAGCKQINIINGLVWNCPTCKLIYCNRCKEVTHPGYTCDQAIEIRQTDAYFVRYMAENGIRKCPNVNCRMPVVKIDGCNKVLCSRCGKSMCFKCKPEEMIAYDTPQLAYDHLNQVHGGYW